MPDVPIRFHLLAMYLRVCACTSHVHGALMHPNNCPKMTRMLLFLIKPTSCAFIQFVSQCFTSFFASRRVAVLWSIKSGAVRSQPIPDTVSDTSISHRSQSDAYRAYEKVQLVTCCYFTASRRGLHIGECSRVSLSCCCCFYISFILADMLGVASDSVWSST